MTDGVKKDFEASAAEKKKDMAIHFPPESGLPLPDRLVMREEMLTQFKDREGFTLSYAPNLSATAWVSCTDEVRQDIARAYPVARFEEVKPLEYSIPTTQHQVKKGP